jgi:2-polyprenyl-6-hydroxyphenyl methylase / 3-demethylubiquinone-9 3-methyltransferase
VTCFEVIEHINDQSTFVKNLAKLVSNNGMIVMSTMAKNEFARLTTIYAAEALGLAPKGTHNYDKYINHEDLNQMAKEANLEMIELKYCFYDPLFNHFFYTELFKTNYLVAFRKKLVNE